MHRHRPLGQVGIEGCTGKSDVAAGAHLLGADERAAGLAVGHRRVAAAEVDGGAGEVVERLHAHLMRTGLDVAVDLGVAVTDAMSRVGREAPVVGRRRLGGGPEHSIDEDLNGGWLLRVGIDGPSGDTDRLR